MPEQSKGPSPSKFKEPLKTPSCNKTLDFDKFGSIGNKSLVTAMGAFYDQQHEQTSDHTPEKLPPLMPNQFKQLGALS